MESTNQNPVEEKNNPRKTSSKSAVLVIFRLFLTVIVAVILGVVIYYSMIGGIPFLNYKIFQPIGENESQVFELQKTQKSLENQLSDISATLDGAEQSGFQATLRDMEADLQSLACLQSRSHPWFRYDLKVYSTGGCSLRCSAQALLKTALPQSSDEDIAYIDEVIVAGNSTTDTTANVTRLDTQILAGNGDGSAQIFYNDTDKTWTFIPGNVSFGDVTQISLNITN